MRSRVILAACVLAAAVAGALILLPMATAPVQEDAGTFSLSPGDHREVCHTLKPGDKRRYSFTSTVPLEFNIHYHVDDAVIDLAVGHNVQSKEGLMAPGAEREEIYCWMWVNLQRQRAELTFRIWAESP